MKDVNRNKIIFRNKFPRMMSYILRNDNGVNNLRICENDQVKIVPMTG